MRIVLLLRGVNIGGVTVRSAELLAALEDAGLARAVTVLASGNAVVDADDPEAARALAERAIERRFGRNIRVAALPVTELRAIVEAYPFEEDASHTPYVVFELEAGVASKLLAHQSSETEPLSPGDGVVYWSNPLGTTTTSAFSRALGRIGKDSTTTRNLRTLRKIIAAA